MKRPVYFEWIVCFHISFSFIPWCLKKATGQLSVTTLRVKVNIFFIQKLTCFTETSFNAFPKTKFLQEGIGNMEDLLQQNFSDSDDNVQNNWEADAQKFK